MSSPRRAVSPARRKRLERRCAEAAACHRQGRLAQSADLYRQVLQVDPDHPGALHGQALVLRQQGDRPGAIALLERLAAMPAADAAALNNLGNLYREADRLGEAIGAYGRALALAPEHHNARFALAACLLDEGRPDAAAAELERLLAAHPGDPALLNSLGLARLAAGDPVGARERFRAATESAPDDAGSWQNLAQTCLLQDALEEALAAARRAFELAPADRKVQRTLGQASLAMEHYEDAVTQLSAVVEAMPDDHLARLWLARAHCELGHNEAAVAQCDEGLRRAPQRADFHAFRGNALRRAGRYPEAIAAFEAALVQDPGWVDALNNLSIVYSDLGDQDKAAPLLARALELEPESPEVWLNIARSQSASVLDEASVKRLEQSLARRDLPHESRIAMHFALAQACDRRKDFDRAFEHYAAGNALKRRTARFNPAHFRKWVAGIRDTFTREFLGRLAGCGDDSERPVFIVGMPRSGTTLVEQIVSSHPQVFGADELTRVTELTDQLVGPAGEGYPHAAAALSCDGVAALAADYLGYLESLNRDAARVTDKMPSNHFHLGLIAVMLPRARIIHCRRDPMDACLSNYIQLFGDGHFYSYDLDDIAVYHNEYTRLMAYWHERLPGRILDVQYEELVEHQERESRRLLAYLDLPWDPRCLEFHKTRRAVRTASHHQVRQPIYKSARRRWKNYERHLAGLRAALEGAGGGQ